MQTKADNGEGVDFYCFFFWMSFTDDPLWAVLPEIKLNEQVNE